MMWKMFGSEQDAEQMDAEQMEKRISVLFKS